MLKTPLYPRRSSRFDRLLGSTKNCISFYRQEKQSLRTRSLLLEWYPLRDKFDW